MGEESEAWGDGLLPATDFVSRGSGSWILNFVFSTISPSPTALSEQKRCLRIEQGRADSEQGAERGLTAGAPNFQLRHCPRPHCAFGRLAETFGGFPQLQTQRPGDHAQ